MTASDVTPCPRRWQIPICQSHPPRYSCCFNTGTSCSFVVTEHGLTSVSALKKTTQQIHCRFKFPLLIKNGGEFYHLWFHYRRLAQKKKKPSFTLHSSNETPFSRFPVHVLTEARIASPRKHGNTQGSNTCSAMRMLFSRVVLYLVKIILLHLPRLLPYFLRSVVLLSLLIVRQLPRSDQVWGWQMF